MAQIRGEIGSTLTEEDKVRIAQESDILQLKFELLGVCGKSVTKNTMELGSILDYGISHGLEIQHFPPEPIKYTDEGPDEEFLVIDGEGNPRVAKNLEGVLFFMNDQRNKGICCLEPNPLWPIKVNLNRTPHIIEVDADSKSPLLINGFYTGIFELQNEPDKKSGKSPVDEFIYAERLRLNSDFVPNIKLPDGVDKEDVRMEIEVNNLKEALKHYGTALEGLGNLRENVRKNYSENFLEFCQEQRLSDLETNDVVLGILKNNNEVRNYFTNKQNIESLVEKLKVGEQIEEETVNKNIRNEVTKILINDKIKEMLLSKPDNYDLKAKIFDILPNINLLKGFEIKKEVKGKESENFLECLDDYIELVVDRREQLMNRLSHVIDVEHLIFRDVDVKIDNLKSEITKNESIKSKLEDKVKKLEIRRKRIIKYHSKLDKLRLNGKEINNYWRRMVIEERNRKKLPNRSVVGR